MDQSTDRPARKFLYASCLRWDSGVALSVRCRRDGLADNGTGVRWPRRETNDSHQSSDEVRTVWRYTSIPYIFS